MTRLLGLPQLAWPQKITYVVDHITGPLLLTPLYDEFFRGYGKAYTGKRGVAGALFQFPVPMLLLQPQLFEGRW